MMKSEIKEKLPFSGHLDVKLGETIVYYINSNFHVLGMYGLIGEEEYHDLGIFPNVYDALEAANKHWEDMKRKGVE